MYQTINDLPEPIRTHIPDEHLQQIVLDSYTQSWDDYKGFRGGAGGEVESQLRLTTDNYAMRTGSAHKMNLVNGLQVG